MLIYKDFDPIQTCINPNLGVEWGITLQPC